ncbi:ABC transporter permease [Pusillimonas noertemannii]|uniref:Peptide/nickel transport system permease protein n=1 Tax=Pusillimonas noertemannii TaxID=305977 RepID=A0A2U1CKX6_9BURK|nr:ABC transporter permease [Pusillimonas noertemannii]NYT69198.1 ABC transporter permease [Pusillimonas noertemannii]PVY61666.1 peptide/nickel transport system permease protein [Pusillimonas noertemannii]TFL09607.1 ABC transporter permease [Pusillimonas noertemannii]
MNANVLFRRLLLAIPTLFGVALVVFVLLRLIPGDPVAMMIVGESTPEDIQQLRVQFGLDKSIPHQFLIFLQDIATGNLGTSIMLKQDVLTLVLKSVPATLELAVVAIIISLIAGFLFALAATYWRGGILESLIDSINSVALAIPEFLWALLLILAFGVMWPVLPLSGRIDPSRSFDFSTQFYLFESLATLRFSQVGELLQHLILPATALALPLLAVIARVLKSSLLEANVQDYILLARVKGFARPRVLFRHALPNALLPTITLTGVNFVFLVGGTVLVELIFAYPGIGNLLYVAAINRDLPLIQGVTIVFAFIFVIMNFAFDLLHSALNVRARH